MDHLLEMRNLSIDLYRGRRTPPVKLVEGIDLNIDKKQNFGIVGESGCGKSITCSSIMGLLSFPLSVGAGSSIRFQRENGTDTELLSLPKKQMQQLRGKEISMIFQEPMTALDPMYTIEDQIVESLCFHTDLSRSAMREAALEMLRKVKIPRAEEILKEYPHHLSGGMLQRVMIAIALINNPRLLIADEPTTALDVTIQAQILDLMNELRESYDTSVIMITHDLGVIAETCEQVAVFYAGQVVEQASVDDIFHHTAHPYTSGLLRSVTSLGGEQKELYTIRGTVPTAGQFSSGCRFADRCEHCTARCREAVPPLTEVAPGHQCRCWLHAGGAEKEAAR
ncbi:ABC transporter ATP-binding protein [Pseudoflavonifractor sp. MCC625]|uniref:ABC transporter ATP-binding protein n=1 Tax=Pseudoflavonifractor sp. MCC625 TaxID=2592647 RepID=UPI001C00E7AB|nr:ABC transporter ATP-binding protein [Pseudoflavonifractor sp. MCC625]MBT9684670.1 ATP-binding cassette domain-containing protein [Pseudoflavonifractor sp. MCC625]